MDRNQKNRLICLALVDKGLSLKAAGDYEDVLNYYHLALEFVPKECTLKFNGRYEVNGERQIKSEIWNLIMNVHQDKSDLNGVQKAYQNAISFNPNNQTVENNYKLTLDRITPVGPTGTYPPQ